MPLAIECTCLMICGWQAGLTPAERILDRREGDFSFFIGVGDGPVVQTELKWHFVRKGVGRVSRYGIESHLQVCHENAAILSSR
jgi:hypothetical protein